MQGGRIQGTRGAYLDSGLSAGTPRTGAGPGGIRPRGHARCSERATAEGWMVGSLAIPKREEEEGPVP